MGVHTLFDTENHEMSGFNVDVKITEFTKPTNPDWLYFFALQVDFNRDGAWAHGGLQHTGQFRDHNSLGVNWGGQSHTKPSGDGIGHNVVPFQWSTGTWYQYQVSREAPQSGAAGNFHWLFKVVDLETSDEHSIGRVETISEYIARALVFTEDGYGSEHCESPTTKLEWRNPQYRVPDGLRTPTRAIASYNGQPCPADKLENQAMIANTDLEKRWYHVLRVQNTTPEGTVLWGA